MALYLTHAPLLHRSVAVAPRQPQLVPQAASMPSKSAPNDDVIDKASFFNAPKPVEADQKRPKSAWVCASLRPVPAFYPLEKSSRFVDDEKDNVTERLSECLRVLSVQAIYNNETVSLRNICCRQRATCFLRASFSANRQAHT